MRGFASTVIAVAFALVAGAAQAANNDVSPADQKALHDYSLSMTKINAMQSAQDEMQKMAKANPDIAKRYQGAGEGKTLADTESRLNAIPPLVTVLHKHGLSTQDAVLMPMALMGAAVAAQYPSAAGKLSAQVSPAQITFFKAHEAELKKMPWLYGGGE